MKLKVFTIPFNESKGTFEDADMQDFMLNKKVQSYKAEFFSAKGRPYWSVLVEYEEVIERKANMPALSEPERALYDLLLAWRKETADKEGVPLFIIATNSELAALCQKAPRTMDGLRQIKGFGNKKSDKYGKTLLHTINNFYERDNTVKNQS